jgi:hypothetical protein
MFFFGVGDMLPGGLELQVDPFNGVFGGIELSKLLGQISLQFTRQRYLIKIVRIRYGSLILTVHSNL